MELEIIKMIERIRSTIKRSRDGTRRGGRRAGQGRRFGSVNEAKRVARSNAERTDMLPHELLLDWALTGRMYYPGTRKTLQLEPSDRISCAKGCAAWYKPAMQPRPAPGEQPPVVRLELDEKMIAALAKSAPDKLDVLRDVFRTIQAGGVDLNQVAGGSSGSQTDPSRYGRMLSETSEVDGRA